MINLIYPALYQQDNKESSQKLTDVDGPQLNMSDRKAVIKNADMSEDMQQDAVDCASQALEKYNIEKVCITRFVSL